MRDPNIAAPAENTTAYARVYAARVAFMRVWVAEVQHLTEDEISLSIGDLGSNMALIAAVYHEP
jgi:hypothetical protein